VECVVFGVGTRYVFELHESLLRLSWRVRAYIVNMECQFLPDSLDPLIRLEDMPTEWTDLAAVIPLTTPGYRQAARNHALSVGFRTFPAVRDPTAVMASSTSVGPGVVINSGVVIGAHGRLGAFSLVNRSVSVGHDVVIGDYASLGPACVLCGETDVGRGAFVGAGAVVLPGVKIGCNAVVGAGTVVVRDVAPGSLVVGNPGRVIKSVVGHNGVAVDEEDQGLST
jgi:sugar O-acyltransferase (sialic acid O-acetyltransferase NeuD family)